jgi:hypothetical protein
VPGAIHPDAGRSRIRRAIRFGGRSGNTKGVGATLAPFFMGWRCALSGKVAAIRIFCAGQKHCRPGLSGPYDQTRTTAPRIASEKRINAGAGQAPVAITRPPAVAATVFVALSAGLTGRQLRVVSDSLWPAATVGCQHVRKRGSLYASRTGAMRQTCRPEPAAGVSFQNLSGLRATRPGIQSHLPPATCHLPPASIRCQPDRLTRLPEPSAIAGAIRQSQRHRHPDEPSPSVTAIADRLRRSETEISCAYSPGRLRENTSLTRV